MGSGLSARGSLATPHCRTASKNFSGYLKNLWQQFKKKDYRMWQSNRRHCNHHLHLSPSSPSSTSWSLSTFSKFPGTWMTRWPGSSSLESMRWETFFFISRAIFFLHLLFVNQYIRGELFSFSKVRWSSGFPSESIGISWRGIMSWQNMRAYKLLFFAAIYECNKIKYVCKKLIRKRGVKNVVII